ncbi:hypothetical protein LTS14_003006 [Recurvomyces mirabilis]|uniref:uncharacterized protein n=1 Tax=Recurvomyces mirabilis TaxID=574656 RepID=UPI002DDDE043|nr:hypothetical protein LTS14_003006 [Recurvomyces mirabilis]
MPTQRHLLLCFDAFGTLFTPKRPIPQQYGDVARSLGLSGFTDDQVHSSFRAAFKAEAKKNPTFGKANGMDPTTWWTNIIHNTFHPLTNPDNNNNNTSLPPDLAPKLLHRFASEEGYNLAPGTIPLLQTLRAIPPAPIDKLAIGIITNSDDRVPGILTSLGLRVSPLVYSGDNSSTVPNPEEEYDIDFTVLSYDVGHEKPDRRIFDAAEELLISLPIAQGTEAGEWQKVYVGDEYGKDVVGAGEAGWGAVLLGEDAAEIHDDVLRISEGHGGDLLEVLHAGQAVSVKDFTVLAQSLGLPTSQSEP